MELPKLWPLIKSTLLEKNSDTPVGSIKRYAAWILLGLVSCVVLASLIPSGQMHLGNWLTFSWHHIKVDMPVLSALLTGIGSYVLGGAGISTVENVITNYHNQKYGSDTPDPNAAKQ